MTSKPTRLPAVSLTALALGHASIAMAESPANAWMEQDRSSLAVGAYHAGFDTKVRLSAGASQTGTTVDAEADFGLDDSSTNLFLHADYRFRPKHRLDFAYYDLSRDGSKGINKDIDFGDVTFPVGATVDSKFDYRVAKLTYSYSLLQNRKVDLALAAGIFTAFYDFRSTDIETGLEEGDDGIAPVPILGLRGAYSISPRWMVNGYLEYLEIDSSDASGKYVDTTISLEYKLGEKTGIGLAYNLVNINGEDKSSDDEADFEYDGVMLYVFYNFQ